LLREADRHVEYRLRIKPWFDAAKLPQAANHEAKAAQAEDQERSTSKHEQAPRPSAAAESELQRPLALLQSFIDSFLLKRREGDKTGEDNRRQRKAKRVKVGHLGVERLP